MGPSNLQFVDKLQLGVKGGANGQGRDDAWKQQVQSQLRPLGRPKKSFEDEFRRATEITIRYDLNRCQ